MLFNYSLFQDGLIKDHACGSEIVLNYDSARYVNANCSEPPHNSFSEYDENEKKKLIMVL